MKILVFDQSYGDAEEAADSTYVVDLSKIPLRVILMRVIRQLARNSQLMDVGTEC